MVGCRMELEYEQSATGYVAPEIDDIVIKDERIGWQTDRLAFCWRQGNPESKRYSSHSLQTFAP